jgi:flagellar hook assembly protein FlgD
VGIGIVLEVGGGSGTRGLRVSAAPNPAREGVAVRVESGQEGEQEVGVYDVSGRRVRELSRGWYGSGARVVGWDGRDSAGARAPAGVYLVRLSAGGRMVQTRVTLLQ